MNTPVIKAFRDLTANKSRAVLVVLAIFFGVFGTGLILDLSSVAGREMDSGYMSTNPYSFSIRLNDYDDGLITSLYSVNGVEQVETRRTVRARTEIAPYVWRTSFLYVIEDFTGVRIDTFTSVSGAPVPGIGEVLIEKESLPVIGKELGEEVNIKISLNTPKTLGIAGSVHAPGLKPAWMEKTVYGFIIPETLEILGTASENHDLLFVVSEDIRFTKSAIQKIAIEIRDALLEKGYTVDRVTIPTPGKHPNGDQMNALLFLFQLFGGLSLLLSGVLVINIISSMLSGQVRQIGVMKAVGAKRGQIAGMYYGIVLISGAAALALAMPLAAAVSKYLVDLCASMLNFTAADYHIPLWPFAVQLAAGLIVPILAATYPILKGTRITVREALMDYGTSRRQFGSSRLDKWLGRMKGTRLPLLSLRNTFRRKGRLMLTVATLAAGGAILIISLNIKSSLDKTVEQAMTSLNYDLQFFFSNPYPEMEVMQTLKDVPGVTKVEMLAGGMVSMIYEDGTENNAFQLAAVPGGMETLNLPVLQGRFIVPGDTGAIVLNHAFLNDEPHLRVGDTITLKSNGRYTEWTIAGIVKEVGAYAKAYVNRDYYQAMISQEGFARAVHIVTAEHGAETHNAVSKLVEKALLDIGVDVMLSSSFSDTREIFVNHLTLIAGFLAAASGLVIIVGVMGLVSAMSVNIMERIQEIGIMRSCGAVSKDILHIVIFEGVLTGVLSWVLSTVISIPSSFAVGDIFGGIFLQTPLDNGLSPLGYALWLIIVITITAFVGFGVTLKMLEMPVNEVLSYE
ncbi:MAG: ABC transporter permease [Clostridia bacterium]|nr:ABC transporter permease [Clostridia bacterium]